MNTDYLIQTAIMLRTALEAVEAQLAQGRISAVANVQQLVLEEEQQPALVGGWTMKETPRKNRDWTAEEDSILLAGKKLGLSHQEIGDRMGRSRRAVDARLLVLKSGAA